ncbi:MAG: chemotaxis protein CheB [Gemmatimonadota bacterium]
MPRSREHVTPGATNGSPPIAAFPIIAVGASAGGLDALERFFAPVPASCAQAFVVVQHLDPTQRALLVELLQHATPLPVVEVTNGLTIEPGHVYVIPPNADISVLHGILHTLEPSAPRGLRLPVDFFFRSLAADAGSLGVGVLLSGMGSDGTLGLRAIKEHFGAGFVQEPSTAKFDPMPRSAINAGLADVVAAPEALYAAIVAYLAHGPQLPASDDAADLTSDPREDALDKVIILVRAQTGHDFTCYKRSTIFRRVERRMALHHLADMRDYVRYLRESPAEGDLLFRELLIGVTKFFRDPAVWEQLQKDVLPELITALPPGGALRAWVPGCSTGEEAYSLAIAFREVMIAQGRANDISLQVFATDLDPDAIERARTGLFPASIAADVSEERLAHFFVTEDAGYRVAKSIREIVVFAPQNLVMDPPFTRLDLVTCRNLLIYLTTEMQQRLLPLFHYSLRPGGYLLLGTAESLGAATALFATVPGKNRLFRRLDVPTPSDPVIFPANFSPTRARTAAATPAASVGGVGGAAVMTLQQLAEQRLLKQYAPAAVVVGDQGDILYVSGRTGPYLEPAAGKANWNLFAMLRDGLSPAVSDGFWRAVRRQETVTLEDVSMIRDGRKQLVRVVLEPQADANHGGAGTVMVVFTDVVVAAAPLAGGKKGAAPRGDVRGDAARNARVDARGDALSKELAQVESELRSAREEMQASHEELRSTNEELQSANEELQSTNEELTTSKEEIQSMNEELQTVNHELQTKLDELTRTSSDMSNLLNSTSIATLFLDRALVVRRYTTPMTSIIKLIASDVGRPVTDLTSTLDFPEMAEAAREVFRTLIVFEREVAAKDGRWFRSRIMPYRTHDDRVDGLVLTFSDITKAKQLEAELRRVQSALEGQLHDQSAGTAADATQGDVSP